LDRIPIWAVFLLLLVAALLALEFGFLWGRWSKRRDPARTKHQLGPLVATHMGLLALMLAFTFGFAANRLDTRKALVIEEANAIGTADLRSRLLLEPYHTNVHRILTEYAEIRAVRLPNGEITLEEALEKSHHLLAKLWVQTEQASRQTTPSDEMRSLFVSSINAVIDLNTQRITVVTLGRIPPMIWVTLALITLLGLGSLGYESGFKSGQRSLVGIPLILSCCVAVTLIVDLDRPHGSLVHVSQKPLLQTLQGIEEGDDAAR
jgi:hypothetical protein